MSKTKNVNLQEVLCKILSSDTTLFDISNDLMVNLEQLDRQLIAYILEQENASEILCSLIKASSRRQLVDLFYAKRIIMCGYDKNYVCHTENIGEVHYKRIVATICPLIFNFCKQEISRIKSKEKKIYGNGNCRTSICRKVIRSVRF